MDDPDNSGPSTTKKHKKQDATTQREERRNVVGLHANSWRYSKDGGAPSQGPSGRRGPPLMRRPGTSATSDKTPSQGPSGRRGPPWRRTVTSETSDENLQTRINKMESNKKRNTSRHGSNKIGFITLQNISESEPESIVKMIMEKKTAFIELINSPIKRNDLFTLFLKCIAKISQSHFFETKSALLMDISKTNFITHLKQYLLELPYDTNKNQNILYWESPDNFWQNLIRFMEFIMTTSATLTMTICRPMVEGLMSSCLEILKQRHDYQLPEESQLALTDIKNKIKNIETHMNKQISTSKTQKYDPNSQLPPDDYRQLSLYPTKEDLLHKKPFVRPNIVDGAYLDKEHYLDVQFRLLREDCFGPVRIGISQFIEDPHKRKYDNIRVFHDVKFVQPYISTNKIGVLVKLEMKNANFFKRLSKSKRFIYGSLVLFTKDNCKTFIVATIIDREEEYLHRGLIPVTVLSGDDKNLANHSYTMIESDVYFEPYYNVLKALKNLSWLPQIPMQKYIVEVNPSHQYPSYLLQMPEKRYIFFENLVNVDDDILNIGEQVEFKVNDEETWPDKEVLNFDEKQFEAFKLALTHEFSVIQGPPGTGKTYVGVKIAQTLYENLKDEVKGCLMLVLCYTNHALDQFLEAILKFTNSVVRIGNQSRNENMKNINLSTLRNNVHCSYFVSQKIELRQSIHDFKMKQILLDVLYNGIVKDKILENIEIKYLKKFYSEFQDPLYHWLFSDYNNYIKNDIESLIVDDDNIDSDFVNFEKHNRKRTQVNVEDDENPDKEMTGYINNIATFSLQRETKLMIELRDKYKKNEGDKHTIMNELRHIHAHITLFNERKKSCKLNENRRIIFITEKTNFNSIKPLDRWQLYFHWIKDLIKQTEIELQHLKEDVVSNETKYEEIRMITDREIIKNKKVIGMTTSGAAKMHKMLLALAPPIVIVEEAAEVLEQHVVASLTEKCKHLILIGDHQQLRPSSSHMKLAKYYNIEVSLFERMIMNGIHSRRLGVQHRMRPEIAALITPHIYETLDNHHSVYHYPDVKGMTKNLFFFTHDYKEEELEDNMSRTNCQEADLVLEFADYLMKQGYSPDVVTILAAYKGQMFYMRKMANKYLHLQNVNITVVDNYQGEESDIILLSLVRNNEENNVGFLATPNRICVALSRAKHGLYIFGNINILKSKSELWIKISETLESNDSLGSTLTLQCENHPDNLTEIKTLEDFQKVPEGGCRRQCGLPLARCEHKCELLCHGYDRDHKTAATNCRKKCERILCEYKHVCPLICSDTCAPCKEMMPKKLPCGHEKLIYCHLAPDDKSVKCEVKLEVTLPACGHKNVKQCHENINSVRCMVKCEMRLDKCGHTCALNCHVKNDPNHEMYKCKKPCPRPKKGCSIVDDNATNSNHNCPKKCYEECDDCQIKVLKTRSNCKHILLVPCNLDVNSLPCEKKCSRMATCGIHFCKKLCKEDCNNCEELILKEIPSCKHKVSIKCSVQPEQNMCNEKCSRTMSCGHKCPGLCKDECDTSRCRAPSDRSAMFPCGHANKLPCNISQLPSDRRELWQLSRKCVTRCDAVLACGHTCAASCGRCAGGRLHAPCAQPCPQLNVCGHRCKQACNQICPPCSEKCEIRCEHNRCGKLCGEPCTTCKEKCARSCSHGKCSRLCGKECSVGPCGEACARALACGHACRGLCAQPCPPVCSRCDPDRFPTDILGDPYDDHTRLILLQDCGHVMDVEFVDNIVRVKQDIIQLPKCPICRTPIVNTRRYKDDILKLYKNEINPIKMRVYGTKKENDLLKTDLSTKLETFGLDNKDTLKESKTSFEYFKRLKMVVENKKKISKLELGMGLKCLEVLELITENVASYLKCENKFFHMEFQIQVDFLCNYVTSQLKSYVMHISQQQQLDLALEIRRLHYIVQFAKLNTPSDVGLSDVASKAFKEATANIFGYVKFDDDKAASCMKNLQDALKIVTEQQQRALIVKAIGLKAGHWYKCPNGHFYCIGECGGANQIGHCADCGAKIGGAGHRLTDGNLHAPEMDGSRYAAWSDQYNNMGNFLLNL